MTQKSKFYEGNFGLMTGAVFGVFMAVLGMEIVKVAFVYGILVILTPLMITGAIFITSLTIKEESGD